MFFRKKLKKLGNQERCFQFKENYNNIIKLAEIYISQSSEQDQIMLLDYLIKSILDDVCSSVIVAPLIKHPDGILPAPFPIYYKDETGAKRNIKSGSKVVVELSQKSIYVRPWNNMRTADSLKNISKAAFEYKQDNHSSYFYRDMDLCYVYNGNHSINAGRYFKKGFIYADELCTELLYPHCDTDGTYWYDVHSGRVTEEVSDFRLAAVYSLARMKYNIVNRDKI